MLEPKSIPSLIYGTPIWPTLFSKKFRTCPGFRSLSGKTILLDQAHCFGAVITTEETWSAS